MRSLSVALTLALAHIVQVVSAMDTAAQPPSSFVPWSGEPTMPMTGVAPISVLATETVHVARAAWLRLHFDELPTWQALRGGARIDADVQLKSRLGRVPCGSQVICLTGHTLPALALAVTSSPVPHIDAHARILASARRKSRPRKTAPFNTLMPAPFASGPEPRLTSTATRSPSNFSGTLSCRACASLPMLGIPRRRRCFACGKWRLARLSRSWRPQRPFAIESVEERGEAIWT